MGFAAVSLLKILNDKTYTHCNMQSFLEENLSDHKGHLLQTCSDCLLWTDAFRNQDFTGRNLLQFSESNFSKAQKPINSECRFNFGFFSARSGKVDPQDVEIFKKQLQRLNFLHNFHSYDGKIGQ